MLRFRTRRRAAGDRGAVLVEAALVLPVLLMITLAVIDFGMYFSSSSTSTSSTRDGSRYASAFVPVRSDKVAAAGEVRDVVVKDLKALTGRGTPVKLWVYRATANGDPVGGDTCTQSCTVYTWNAATSTFDYQPGMSAAWTPIDACVTTASPMVDEVGVMVQVAHQPLTPVLGLTPRTIKERTVLRLEPLPTSQC